jgi:uncharacterized cupredoxin-like copper-binding protein
VPAAGEAAYTLVVTPVGAATLPAGVSLAAGNVPLGATVTFAPSTVTASSGTTNVTLNVNLPSNSANERPRGPFGWPALPITLGLVLLPFARRLRRARARLFRLAVLLLLGAALATGVTGCGGVLGSHTFSFTVTANSGSLEHSVTAQLTVK